MSCSPRPRLEVLEDRALPTAGETLEGGVLTILGRPLRANTALVSHPASGGVSVTLNGETTTFTDPVTKIVYKGGQRANTVANNTGIEADIRAGNGRNIITGGSGKDVITLGNGNNFVTDAAGDNVIKVGN